MSNFKLFFAFITISIIFFSIISGCDGTKEKDKTKNIEEVKKMEKEFQDLMNEVLPNIKKTYRDLSESYWVASLNSTPENWQKVAELEMLLNSYLSNKEVFQRLKKIKEANLITEAILLRQLEEIYLTFLAKQIDTTLLNAMTKLGTEIEHKYSTFRAKIGKKEYTDNEVEEILKTSKDSKMLQQIWEAHKNIGLIVKDDILKLVKMRNEAAQKLGFKNFHEMSLILSGQDPEEIEKLFNQLDSLTRDTYISIKSEMDKILAEQCKISVEKLMPWHYQNRYFQEAPQIYEVDIDAFYSKYSKDDIVKITQDYYQSIGLPIDDIVARSDLFEKKNKNQHAYCIDIDRDSGDIRVLGNVKPNSKWMETMLHEYGHALYEKYFDKNLPWVLKEPAHIFTTEAIAMLFGRFAMNPQWMKDVIGISQQDKEKIIEITKKKMQLQQLVFSRWSQVMYRFEKAMYADPDQDLNKLWWDLVEKYQMIKKPEGRNAPDWATKIHIATSPCYYHNYHLGELLASQLYFTISEKILKDKVENNPSFYNKPAVGKYLIENVFSVGKKYKWNDMIEKATGEKLTPKYYAKQFVN